MQEYLLPMMLFLELFQDLGARKTWFFISNDFDGRDECLVIWDGHGADEEWESDGRTKKQSKFI